MNTSFQWRAALAVLVSAGIGALSGCGGGGGGGGGAAPVEPPVVPLIGGTVLGLSSSVALQNNGADDLSVTADGAFTFTTPAASYDVTVLNQPAGQTCSVSNGLGTTVGPIGTVIVECVTLPVSNFTIGGAASGLSGALVLRNNGGDDLSVAANGRFTFSTPTSAYHVTLLSQPAGQACSVSNGKGIAGAPVTGVALICANVSGTLALHAGNLGGYGSADGSGAAAGFNGPQGVATDGAGNVYVADGGNQAIRRITPAGVVTTFAGSAGVGGAADGMGGAARFSNPQGVATDGAGNVFVADTGNHTIRRITPAGEVTTLAGSPGVSGSVDSTGAGARFNLPTGVAVDVQGNVFVADSGNHAIRKVSSAGVVSTWAGSVGNRGLVNGSGAAARFNNPYGLAFDSAGNLFVGDTNNDAIRKIASDGAVSTFAASLIRPAGLSTDGAGNVYVAQVESYVISKITPAGAVTTLAGTANLNGAVDGSGAAARFYRPFGVATDGAGNVYVADTGNSLIRRIDTAVAVTTLAGSVAIGGSADGTGPAARFLGASGVVTDSAGFIYVADRLDHAIRKITPAGEVSTFAGTRGSSGAADGAGATAALFSSPVGLAIDGADNVYVADRGNHAIRKISPSGVVSTIGGSLGTSGSADGTAGTARFFNPEGVAVDNTGIVYVADTGNHTIRRIDLAGNVTTLAGLAGDAAFADGNGAAARFNAPLALATNAAGEVFVIDASDTIRKITPGGEVSTFAGLPNVPGSADGAAADARFDKPMTIAADGAGNFFVADRNNNAIRRISAVGQVATIVGVAGQSGFAPGALQGRLTAPVGVTVRGSSMYITMPTGVAVVQNLQ